MANKIQEKKERVETIDEIMMLIEIIRELEELDDVTGNSYTMKFKVASKIETLIDKL